VVTTWHLAIVVAVSTAIAGQLPSIDTLEPLKLQRVLEQFPSMKLARRVSAGKTDRNQTFTREGMAVRDGQLILLPEDNSTRVFFFRLLRAE
jgi:hypothetical protein